MLLLNEALMMVKAAGYRVSKPRMKKTRSALNAVGKPYGANFDPNYRMKHKPASLTRLYAPFSGPFVTG
jgi:hypothetical protein